MPLLDGRQLAHRLFLVQQLNMLTIVPPGFYLVVIVAQMPQEKVRAALYLLAVWATLFSTLAPYAVVRASTISALAVNPSDPPGARLARILKLPRLIELRLMGVYTFSTSSYLTCLVLGLDMPPVIIPWVSAVIVALFLLTMVWTRILFERMLMPYALEEFSRTGTGQPLVEGQGLLWTKQRWYLPYAFALFVVCTLLTAGTVVSRMAFYQYQKFAASLTDEAVLRSLEQNVSEYLSKVWLPLSLVGAFMLISSAVSALLLARHLYSGFQALRRSIESFANGSPQRPAWVATDELGELAQATSRALDQIRDFSLALRQTASTLGDSAQSLDQSNTLQNQGLTRYATALQQTQVTAQEIRQASLLAAQKAESVLMQVDTAEKLGRSSESAIAQSIASLQTIYEEVKEMATRIKSLGDRTQQISNITLTVKNLADNSNMLALNAAIEAVRSGEHGKGFGVVAREMRSLADKSISATVNVRQMLKDISEAIQSTVKMTERGMERVGTSVEQVRLFGDNMRQMSSILQDNSAQVRQISAAVNQQNQGVVQIFQALNDLNTIMEETMQRMQGAQGVTMEVRQVSNRVSQLITRYGWDNLSSEVARR